jgi:putative membrane protein
VLAAGLAACSSNSNTPSNAEPTDTASAIDMAPAATGTATTAADSHAAAFLTDAMKGDNSEVKAGNMAADKGSTQAVKDFGKMLATDHGTHLTKVTALAQSMGVPTTNDVTPDAAALATKLQGLSGKDFDKAFVAGMIADHKKAIDMYQKEASSSDPAPLTSLAKDTVPTLQKHLKAAEALQ